MLMQQLLQSVENYEFRLFHRIPSSEEDGTKFNSVISGDMCLGNNTSHEIIADHFARNRGENFVQPSRKSDEATFSTVSGAPGQ